MDSGSKWSLSAMGRERSLWCSELVEGEASGWFCAILTFEKQRDVEQVGVCWCLLWS